MRGAQAVLGEQLYGEQLYVEERFAEAAAMLRPIATLQRDDFTLRGRHRRSVAEHRAAVLRIGAQGCISRGSPARGRDQRLAGPSGAPP